MSANVTPNAAQALPDWPINGVHRVEASAGTGKTFALALLHTRLVVERALPVKRILAVTFTIAATQELRERLRVQLGRAAELALLDPAALAEKCASADAAEAMTATVLERRLREEPAAELASRLRRAVGEIDLAAIHTIHAFCQRVLSEHALMSGEPLLPNELLTSERALHDEVALDVWRHFTRERETASMLETLWKTPDILARDLRKLVVADTLLPARTAVDPLALADFQSTAAALREAWQRHGGQARDLIERARDSGVLHKGRPQAKSLQAMWVALDAFAADSALEEPACESLDVLTPTGLAERVNAKYQRSVPTSPAFAVVAAFVSARTAAACARAKSRANLLHDVRDYALARLAAVKRTRSLVGFDDLIGRVHAALSSADGARLAHALRLQYPAALVDEFQDTDAHQWEIFRRIYVESGEVDAVEPTLFLIGDPKQAIYRFRGGDVHTYHAAAADARTTWTLERNFRSRPRVLEAIAALFEQGGAFPFGDEQTRFPAVKAGGTVANADLLAGRQAAPGLHLWNLGARNAVGTIRTGTARDMAAAFTAARIQMLLANENPCLRDRDALRRIEPRDIAVLVNRHEEAVRVQRELALRGVPSVTATRASLFDTPEATELLRILEALLAAGEEGLLRAALATVLLGAHAEAIDALSRDETAHRAWLDAFQAWRQRWIRFGPLSLVSDLVAAAAPRLLALGDGERRLTNYLQLAEQLQEARARVLGEAGQADWLARRIADADGLDEAQQLRLESDAERVQIMTLHKAKGLEFGIVFLPFAALPPYDFTGALGLITDYASGRCAQRARIGGLDDEEYKLAAMVEKNETLAEQLRLLYVGLTRARHAIWLATGPVVGAERTALSWLLHRDASGKVAACDAATIDAALDRLAASAPKAIEHEPLPDLAGAPVQAGLLLEPQLAIVREARRVLRRDWWVHSFSQLARAEGSVPERAVDERGAEDESTPEPLELLASPYVGAPFGNALHAALENADFTSWRDWRDERAPEGQESVLRRALSENGFTGEEAMASGARLLGSLVRDTLNVRLPEGVRLADVPPAERRNEIEFHFALRSVAVDRLLELLHRHGILEERGAFGTRERLEGLMTGRIDLVYRHDRRTYLLDYKSNRLADYSPAGLARAVRDSEYDLQYVIYTLALHRWLRFRNTGYDYDAHFGGVRYLFCRGLDPLRADSPGVFATRLAREFVDELDALLAPSRAEAA
jgi:exodeoxyribonuclease V beta subunit